MPVLYPVVSPLHNKEAVESIVKDYCEKLTCEQVSKVPREGVVLVLVCTGGTEHQILEAAKINPHILLLAHKEQNSLPAALEALAGLKGRGIPSKIIFGLDDSSLTELRNGIKIFETAKTLENSRIGIFGFPSPWLVNLPNFSRAEKVFGLKFVHIDLSNVLEEMSHVKSGIKLKAERVECTQKDVKNAVKLFSAVKAIVERENLQALGIKCFDLLELANTTGCIAVSLLNDSGIPAGCEADIPATITMLIVQTLTETPNFMGNLCSISEDKILLAHCTIATRLVKSYILRNHFESGMGVSIQGELFHDPVTLAKIDPEFQKMVLAEGDITGSGLDI